jgi:hypothetical protein
VIGFRKRKQEVKFRRVRFENTIAIRDGEEVLNLYRRILRIPFTRKMDYEKDCLFDIRDQCHRLHLLAAARQQFEDDSPEMVKAGLPGPDAGIFRSFDPFCQACIMAQRPRGLLRRRRHD